MRTASRSLRLIRFRTTARPSDLLTAYPTPRGPSAPMTVTGPLVQRLADLGIERSTPRVALGGHGPFTWSSGGQAHATLAPPSPEHGSATSRTGPLAKTVLLVPFAVVRLIRALHPSLQGRVSPGRLLSSGRKQDARRRGGSRQDPIPTRPQRQHRHRMHTSRHLERLDRRV